MSDTPAPASQAETVSVLAHVDEYLSLGQQYDCSDIHLATNAKPTWRRYGTLQPIWENGEVLTAADTERLAMGFLFQATAVVCRGFRHVAGWRGFNNNRNL